MMQIAEMIDQLREGRLRRIKLRRRTNQLRIKVVKAEEAVKGNAMEKSIPL